MKVLSEVAERTGRKVMYAWNISDETDAMLRHHDTVLEAGGTCVMVSLNHVGVAGVSHLRRHSRLAIHGHRNGWGMLSRHPLLGYRVRGLSENLAAGRCRSLARQRLAKQVLGAG